MESKKSNTAEIPTEKPLRYLKGVGEKLAQLFARKDVFKIFDLLYFFPRAYEDRRLIKTIEEAEVGETVSVLGRVKIAYPVFYSRSRRRSFEVVIEDPEGKPHEMKLVWFQSAYLKDRLTPGTLVMARGEIKNFQWQKQIVHPELEILGKNLETGTVSKGVIPVYSETEGLYQKTLRKIVQTAVRENVKYLEETLPAEVRAKYGYPTLQESLLQIHCPDENTDYDALMLTQTKAQERFIYEEFFRMGVGLALKRKEYTGVEGITFQKPESTWEKFRSNIQFRFTNAQRKVMHEILDDMTSSRVMHRLVQGDVGCGKTVVAAAAALVALEAGYQVAFMAPTELLVEQHLRNFKKWFEGLNIPFSLLTGSLSAREKRETLQAIASDGPRMVFGTHALFEEHVKFSRLGFVVVDEQHRFGVRQRADLLEKGTRPDLLVMTATPIPRTLALTLYGDLELSVIDELPPGRKPITTRVFTDKQRLLLEEQVKAELRAGRQAYIVFPLIEASEKLKLKSIEEMYPALQESYGEFSIGLLHGRMPAEQKQQILEAFRENRLQILVSTTVIEVGVDVPNATVMVIENAERFGLSQLHQLRGRVGRGSEQSFCFLMASHLGTPEIVKRLRTMEKTHDGFKLSEVDLEMRGPGEFLGTRQSGVPLFQLARLPRDFKILERARADAFELVDRDPDLKSIPELKRFLKAQTERVHLN